ncbi:head GIN domain-containing protein [Rufibacter ruber]|uniref:head GIN domain-containing protein n=1 Tax=Rufibacter ruber TaxID=1783499 RepID=UPI000831B08E|nr:head GIN domain-containing protein [Rufibacter ruber]
MKKSFPLLLLVALMSLLQVAQAQTVNGNGKIQTQTRSVGSFTGLAVSGGFEIVLTQGATESLKLEADENILPLIETEVENGVLTIRTKANRVRNAKKLKAYVTVQNLKSLELAGGIKLTSTNTITGSALRMEMAGGINVEMALQVKELQADVAGGTSVTLSGRADKVDLDMAGASSLKAADLKTNYFSIDAAGVSHAEVNVAKELNVDGAGIVSVDYKGSPKVKHTGMGKVRPM